MSAHDTDSKADERAAAERFAEAQRTWEAANRRAFFAASPLVTGSRLKPRQQLLRAIVIFLALVAIALFLRFHKKEKPRPEPPYDPQAATHFLRVFREDLDRKIAEQKARQEAEAKAQAAAEAAAKAQAEAAARTALARQAGPASAPKPDPRRLQPVDSIVTAEISAVLGTVLGPVRAPAPAREADLRRLARAGADRDELARLALAQDEERPPAAPTRARDEGRRIDPAATLTEGTRIPVVLDQPVNTDQPVPVTARVARDVYDSLTASRVLVPQGSILVGEVLRADELDAAARIHWHRLLTPDGLSLTFDDAPSTDSNGGYLDGRRDGHGAAKLEAVLVSSLTAAALQAAQAPLAVASGVVLGFGQLAAEGVADDLSRVTDEWAERRLRRPPTIRLAAGRELLVVVTQDLVFPAEDPTP